MRTPLTQAETLFFAGNQLMKSGKAADAEQCFRQALTLDPNFSEVLTNLGLLLKQAGALAEAETCYKKAISIVPDGVQPYLLLGVMLLDSKRFAEAEKVGRQALQLAPESPVTWSNLGVLLACMHKEDEAELCYRTALKLDNTYAKALFNLGYILLRQGRFAEGWQCLGAREWYDSLAQHFSYPRWLGESLAGKSIVISIEAGHGDMIQFCRYGSMLKSMGATRVALVCHPGLKALFATLQGVDDVISLDEGIPATGFDYWTPPLSLPHYCHTRLENIPADIPYLSADADKLSTWSKLLPMSGYKVGLVWKGNPNFENDADRSLPSLDTLAPLGTVPGIQYVSLQKGEGEDEALRPPDGLVLLALGNQLVDFADTAAVISNLDLVISVDTAVAHLAGALGKPCWLLLPDYRTDWRWLTERTDTPWYPENMRLFRQPQSGNWSQVIIAVVAALHEWKQRQDLARSELTSCT
ncbi:tetratricopeptide repeat protein [Sulfuriferula nivalis]|uniref:Tetratricopeptide repeat protein n=1 Tax=Sulfuriferula nivalis TaxID=2675298 RepID=A0A809RJS7_9PROT|nr:tetratricopeptide repeat-containing glycosyltransferase family protein [Sulfuriferula nivalis]BBP01074.1 hypothetical protein SFSGTM_17820 [Sulfuriferula nivalis]